MVVHCAIKLSVYFSGTFSFVTLTELINCVIFILYIGFSAQMKAFRVLLWFCYLISIKATSCNITYYNYWGNLQYNGYLSTDSKFWIYQTQNQIVLTNFLAMDISFQKCNQLFENLVTFKAGRMGPIDELHTYNVMCSSYCLENDRIHLEALTESSCSCLEISTQSNNTGYHIPGDICRRNTGRLRCDIVGFCGVWNCRLDDFMCPRYEYNKKIIPFKGAGSCSNAIRHFYLFIIIICIITCSILLLI